MLRPRESLLVLDNCEHLIEPVAALVSRILREAPTISMLATSREPLAVPGEHVWSVDPLSTAGADDDTDPEPTSIPAVALFVERARAADPSFVLDDATAPVVVEICRRLDGIPARDRAGGGTGADDRRRRDRPPARRAIRAAQGDAPRQRPAPPHDARRDQLVVRHARARRAGAVHDAVGVRRLLRSHRGRPNVHLRGRARPADAARRAIDADGAAHGSAAALATSCSRPCATTAGRVSATTAAARALHRARVALRRGGGDRGARPPRSAEVVGVERAEASFADMRSAQRFALDVGELDDAFGIIASLREFAMRAMRYEVFAWADAGCRVPGGLDHPLAPTLTGMRAYGAWVRGEFDLAVELADETRRLEARSAPHRVGSPSGCSATCCTSSGAATSATRRRPVNSSSPRSRATRRGWCTPVTWPAVALSSVGRLRRRGGAGAAARTRRRRRPASPTDLASAAVAEGFSARAPDDALEAFVDGRSARPLGRQPLDERVRPHRGERAPRASGRHRRGVCRVSPRWSGSGTAPANGRSSGTRCLAA